MKRERIGGHRKRRVGIKEKQTTRKKNKLKCMKRESERNKDKTQR
jgi:hypothetical protein